MLISNRFRYIIIPTHVRFSVITSNKFVRNLIMKKLLFTYFSLACASEGALEPFPLAYMPGPSSVMDDSDII